MQQMTNDELVSLSPIEIAGRMKAIFREDYAHRYPLSFDHYIRDFEFDFEALLKAPAISSRSVDDQRYILSKSFLVKAQLHACEFASAAQNQFVWDRIQTAPPSTLNLRLAASEQWEIVCTTIAAEAFFELVYVVATARRLRGKKKKKQFLVWAKSERHFLVHYGPLIQVLAAFDEGYRSPEVHAGSKEFPRVLQLLNPPMWSSPNSMGRTELRASLGMSVNTFVPNVIAGRVVRFAPVRQDHNFLMQWTAAFAREDWGRIDKMRSELFSSEE